MAIAGRIRAAIPGWTRAVSGAGGIPPRWTRAVIPVWAHGGSRGRTRGATLAVGRTPGLARAATPGWAATLGRARGATPFVAGGATLVVPSPAGAVSRAPAIPAATR